MMTWQGVALGFVLGFLSWPLGSIIADGASVLSTKLWLRAANKAREDRRAQFERDLAAGLREMTVSEWEEMYGPLPERKPL